MSNFNTENQGSYVITEQGDLGLGLTPIREQEERTSNKEDDRFRIKTDNRSTRR